MEIKEVVTAMRFISSLIFTIFMSCSLYAQYQINASVLGNGGNEISTSDIRITSTVGQSLIGKIQGNNYFLQSGFWQSAQILTPVEHQMNLLPKIYALAQNYPNPFNPSTIIEFQIPEESIVSLKVYDILGRETATLVNGDKGAGNYNVHFSANSYKLSSGIYFYRLEAKSKTSSKHFTKTGKMMLLK